MDLYKATHPLRVRPWVGYLLAVAGSLVALAIRFAIWSALEGLPFITFFPVVLLVAYIAGWLPSCLAIALSAVLASYYLIHPAQGLAFGPSELLGLVFFAAVCGIIVALVQTLVRAQSQLAAVNETLERLVAERTRELEDTNARLRSETETRQAAEAHIRATPSCTTAWLIQASTC